ncbi:MAG: hypothetical protein KF696_08085 [Planctomycetes bacterium]|nr:hypothetical protein [Planctomycetota bacterium]MCW8135691.1 hypothetical protein [Planctomycetota bacterium]
MQPNSLYRAATQAAREWCREIVERLGPAHEAAAYAEWNRDRFWFWVVDRAIEHVEGKVYWEECGRRNFSRAGQRPALDEAVRRVRELQRQLAMDSLPSFKAKEELVNKLAEAANELLE